MTASTDRAAAAGKTSNLLPLILAAAYALFVFSWIFSIPPDSAPDERFHYLRALGAGRGQLILHKSPLGVPQSDKALGWLHIQTRIVSVPQRYSPAAFDCFEGGVYPPGCPLPSPESDTPEDLGTYIGRYPPYSYIVPGVLMRLARGAESALLWGRGGVAAISVGFLALAAFALWDGKDPWSLAGLTVAVTPMVAYVAATLSSSGPETAAAICFFGCLLRLVRGPAPSWVWAAAAGSGVVLEVTRDLGILWTAAALATVAAWAGVRRAREVVVANPKAASGTAVAVGCAAAAALWWQITQQARPQTALADLVSAASGSLPVLIELYRQMIGNFGALEAPLPAFAVALWTGMLAALLGAAILRPPLGRATLVVAATVTGTAVVSLGVEAAMRSIAFGAQGRHLLPLAVAVPLIAGEAAYASTWARVTRLRRLLPVIFVCAAAIVLPAAWYGLGRRYTVGPAGPWLFFGQDGWEPPMGWAPWAFLSLSATGLLAAYAFYSAKAALARPRVTAV